MKHLDEDFGFIMNTYSFEYTDLNFTIKLVTICFVTAFLLLGTIPFTEEYINSNASFVFALITPVIIFFSNVRKIKQLGQGTLSTEWLIVPFEKGNRKIFYKEIHHYRLQSFQGYKLILYLKSGGKIKVQSNEAFCNPLAFGHFAADFTVMFENFTTPPAVSP